MAQIEKHFVAQIEEFIFLQRTQIELTHRLVDAIAETMYH